MQSWFEDEESLQELRDAGWALVMHPNSVGRATVGTQGLGRDGNSPHYTLEPLHSIITAGWVYIRLHGDNDEHTYDYSQEEVRAYGYAVTSPARYSQLIVKMSVALQL